MDHKLTPQNLSDQARRLESKEREFEQNIAQTITEDIVVSIN